MPREGHAWRPGALLYICSVTEIRHKIFTGSREQLYALTVANGIFVLYHLEVFRSSVCLKNICAHLAGHVFWGAVCVDLDLGKSSLVSSAVVCVD